jgi:hypothetical protein
MKNLKDSSIVQAYLEAATREIKDPKGKRDIQDELLGHIETGVLQYLKFGSLDHDSALQKTIDELGSPQELGESFHRVYNRSWAIFLKISGAVAMAVVIAGVVYISSVVQEAHRHQLQQVASINANVDTYLKELVSLDSVPIFKHREYPQADVGEYLNARIIWMLADEKLKARREQPQQPKIFFSKTNTVFRHSFDIKDLSYNDRHLVTLVDLQWMKKLKDYQFWDLYNHGPFSDMSPEESLAWSTDPTLAPLPDLEQFRNMAFLRLIRGHKDPIVALEEVNHLARLLISTESINAAKMALEILLDANRFAERMIVTSKMNRADYSGPSYNWIRAAQESFGFARAIWGYNALREPGIFKKVFVGENLPIGSCAAYLDSSNLALVKNNSDGVGLFADTTDKLYLEHLNQLQDKIDKNCRLTYFKRDLSRNDWINSKNEARAGSAILAKTLLRIPFLSNPYIRYVASQDLPPLPLAYYVKKLYSKNFEKKAPQ